MTLLTQAAHAVGSLALIIGGVIWAGHVLVRPWRRLARRRRQERRVVKSAERSSLLLRTPEVGPTAAIRSTGVALVLESDLADVRARLKEAEALEAEHYNWAMLAISPFTLLLLAAGIFGGPHVLEVAVFGLLVSALQVWRWRRAKGEVRRIENVLEELQTQVEEASRVAQEHEQGTGSVPWNRA